MIFDANFFVALFLAAVCAVALLAVLPSWRRVMGYGWSLPLWRFAQRAGGRRAQVEERLGREAVLEAEIRCGACAAQAECEHRLATRATTPVAHCPNRGLLRRGR